MVVEKDETGEGSSSKQDADVVTDFDSGNAQMFLHSFPSHTNHLMTGSDPF